MPESNQEFAYRMRRKRGEPMSFADHWVELMAKNEGKWKRPVFLDEDPVAFASVVLGVEIPDHTAALMKALACP